MSFRPSLHSSSTRHSSLSSFLRGVFFSLCCVGVLARLPFYVRAQNNGGATATNRSQNRKAEYVPGELLVRFRPGSALARVKTRTSANLPSLAAGRNVRVEIARFGGSDLVHGLMLARVAAEDTFAALKNLTHP